MFRKNDFPFPKECFGATLMRKMLLFCEDSFHEAFLTRLVRRFEQEYRVPVNLRILSARGGVSRMHYEFGQFLRDLRNYRQDLPDCILVARDANCQSYNARRQELAGVLTEYPEFQYLVVYAIPDPHIERWMLTDPEAFRAVFRRGCTLPSLQCEKNEYKRLLRQEIRESGIDAPLGGEEFAADVVGNMDLGHVETREPSFGRLISDLRALFNQWRR